MDDIVEGVVRVMKKAPDRKNGEDGLPIPPYAVYNIGNQNPENLLDFVQILSEETGSYKGVAGRLQLRGSQGACPDAAK